MTQPLANQSGSQNLPDILDIIAGVGLVGGTVASLLAQQVAVAAVPFAISIGLNMANRRRMTNDMLEKQQVAIAQLTQQVNQHQGLLLEQIKQFQSQANAQLAQQSQDSQSQANQISVKIEQIQQVIADLAQENQQMQEKIISLVSQDEKLEEMFLQLRQIENASQALNKNPNSADFYYQRGLSHENLGDIQEAIDDYTKAIALDATQAQAYHNRGIIQGAMGNKKKAAEDLRLAAKFYFEQGDIDNYQKTRELSKEFYEVRPPLVQETEILEPLDEENLEAFEPLLVNNLFA